jgi:hypothetical protein
MKNMKWPESSLRWTYRNTAEKCRNKHSGQDGVLIDLCFDLVICENLNISSLQ